MAPDTTQQDSVEFAAALVDMTLQDDKTFAVIFTSYSIATSTMLVDYVADEEGEIDDAAMQASLENYIAGLRGAVDFAVNSLRQQRLI